MDFNALRSFSLSMGRKPEPYASFPPINISIFDGFEIYEILYFLRFQIFENGSNPERWLHTNKKRPSLGIFSSPLKWNLTPSTPHPTTEITRMQKRQILLCLDIGTDVLTLKDTSRQKRTNIRASPNIAKRIYKTYFILLTCTYYCCSWELHVSLLS